MFHLTLTGKESSAGRESKTVESGQNSGVEVVEAVAEDVAVTASLNGNGVSARPPDIEIADEAAEKLQDLAV